MRALSDRGTGCPRNYGANADQTRSSDSPGLIFKSDTAGRVLWGDCLAAPVSDPAVFFWGEVALVAADQGRGAIAIVRRGIFNDPAICLTASNSTKKL